MTKRISPKLIAISPVEIDKLVDGVIGPARETEAGRLERERLRKWVPAMIAYVAEEQHKKFNRLTWQEQLKRFDAFEDSAAAFMLELADEWVLAEMELWASIKGFVSLDGGTLQGLVRELSEELVGVRYGIDRLRARMADHRAVAQWAVDVKPKEPGGASKPWMRSLTNLCLAYHREHLTHLTPQVKEHALADAMFALLNNSSGLKDQLATARKRGKRRG